MTEPTNHKYIRVADFNDFGSITLENIQYISDEVYNQIKLKLDTDESLLEKYCVWQELPMNEDILKEVQI